MCIYVYGLKDEGRSLCTCRKYKITVTNVQHNWSNVRSSVGWNCVTGGYVCHLKCFVYGTSHFSTEQCLSFTGSRKLFAYLCICMNECVTCLETQLPALCTAPLDRGVQTTWRPCALHLTPMNGRVRGLGLMWWPGEKVLCFVIESVAIYVSQLLRFETIQAHSICHL